MATNPDIGQATVTPTEPVLGGSRECCWREIVKIRIHANYVYLRGLLNATHSLSRDTGEGELPDKKNKPKPPTGTWK